ncbi:MAG: molybdenum cofactor guanylyltransferase [Actinobacteria bacterium]|nr:molybdenum cofactor guanylyltransferase [Actinomycetota bacterium]MDI6830615.1 molybdenum cofactor guanylyltransferase [Actinomycetota bacterium]
MTCGGEGGARREEFAAAVLAGGRGKRLGMDKARLQFEGRPVLDHILSVLLEIFPEVLLVVQGGDSPLAASGGERVKVVADLIPGKGPLVGIYTALRHAPAPYVFVMACDMPYPSPPLIRRLLAAAPGREAVVPRRGEYIEPLFAVYARSILDRVRSRVEEGRLKIHELVRELDVRYLDEEEIAASDPHFRSFFNINTVEDLLRMEADHFGMPPGPAGA